MHKLKTVIFVGGTSYSGSTLLDMVLANTPGGFSCGELTALFYPYRDHHLDFSCGCGHIDCKIWETVKNQGAKHAHKTIFEFFPDIEYIVDSSKDPIWIQDRTNDLVAAGIAVRNILIWKTPEEFYESKKKRRKAMDWSRAWKNYHKLYFRLVKDWKGIQYKRFVTDSGAIDQLCAYLGVPKSDRQFNYWEKEHHTLFGNTSAKIHLYSKAEETFVACAKELNMHDPGAPSKENQDDSYRSIYYKKGRDGVAVKESRSMQQIIDILISRDVGKQLSDDLRLLRGVQATAFLYYARRFKLKIMGHALMAKRAVLGKKINVTQ